MSERPKAVGTSKWNAVGAISLAVLVYSGQLGASPILGWLPVNATTLAAGLVVAAFLISCFRYKLTPWVLLPLGLWVSFVFPALSPVSSAYADAKFFSLMTLTLICVIAPFQVLRFHMQRTAFIGTLAVCAAFAGYLTLTEGGEAAAASELSTDVLILEGANTIGTARIAGTGALILLVLLITTKTRGSSFFRGRRFWFLVLGLALTGVMVATGSRGPFAGIAAGITAVLLLSGAVRTRRFRSLALVVAAMWGAYAWAESRGLISSDRAFAWLAGERDTSTSAREYLWNVASDFAVQHPVGVGWGGFSNIGGVPVEHSYPHNLFLEVYVEAGWLVGSMVVLFAGVSMWRLMRRATEPVAAAMFALAVFAFVNAMVSGDINDNRLLWMMFGVAWALPAVTPANFGGSPESGSSAERAGTHQTIT